MSTAFTKEQQAQIKEALFQAGIRLSKEFGLQRMTVSKLAQAAGIAKGSFYHFFDSKEAFILALSTYDNNKMNEMLAKALNGRDKMTTHEFFIFVREYLYSDYDFMGRLTIDDYLWMRTHMNVKDAFNPQGQLGMVAYFLSLLSDAQECVDHGVIVNLIKSIYALREHRATMVENSLDTSIEIILCTLELYVSGKGELPDYNERKEDKE